MLARHLILSAVLLARSASVYAQTFCADVEGAALVADDGTAVVGWMHVGTRPYLESDESADILGLVVAEGQRSRGIGAALVTAAETWAVEHGCQMIRVWSRITRDRAHAFYERGGFERIKTQYCFQKIIRGSSA